MTPGLPKKLVLGNGRHLCYQSFGPESGEPVLFLHGFPGSRLQAALVEDQAVQAGAHLLAFDRPGFGGSSPDPSRTIRGLARDVEALVDRLRWETFRVVGVSCGGAYALACAHELPSRVSKVALVAGIAPMDIPGLARDRAKPLRVLFGLAKHRPWMVAPMLRLDRALFTSRPDAALRFAGRLLGEHDRKLLLGNDVLRCRFTRAMAEAYRQGSAASAMEAHLLSNAWGFSIEAIEVPVEVHQGGSDRHVPPLMGRYLADRLPNARLYSYPTDGHLSVIFNSCPAWLSPACRTKEVGLPLWPRTAPSPEAMERRRIQCA